MTSWLFIRSVVLTVILFFALNTIGYSGHEPTEEVLRKQAEQRFLNNYRASLPGYRGKQTMENQLVRRSLSLVNPSIPPDDETSPIDSLPKDILKVISLGLDPIDAAHFGASCSSIHPITAKILEPEIPKAKVAKKVRKLLRAFHVEEKVWENRRKLKKELWNYLVELTDERSPLLAIAFQQVDGSDNDYLIERMQR